jgi:hypothetical protein
VLHRWSETSSWQSTLQQPTQRYVETSSLQHLCMCSLAVNLKASLTDEHGTMTASCTPCVHHVYCLDEGLFVQDFSTWGSVPAWQTSMQQSLLLFGQSTSGHGHQQAECISLCTASCACDIPVVAHVIACQLTELTCCCVLTVHRTCMCSTCAL